MSGGKRDAPEEASLENPQQGASSDQVSALHVRTRLGRDSWMYLHNYFSAILNSKADHMGVYR